MKRTTTASRKAFSKRKPVRSLSNAAKRPKAVATRKPPPKPFLNAQTGKTKQQHGEEERERAYVQQISAEEKADREARVAALRDEIVDTLHALPLYDTLGYNSQFVFARGPVDASLMIVGEAPGAEEAKSGKPFVGASGQKITEYLRKVGIDPERHVYVTNVVLIRPPNNRNPTWEEVTAYAPYLKRHIDIIRPKIILCMGAYSSTVLHCGLGSTNSIRGDPHDRIPNAHLVKTLTLAKHYKANTNFGALIMHQERFGCRFYMSYHPSYILRDVDNERGSADRWLKDFETVAEALYESPLEYIDAADIVRDSTPAGYVFAQPEDTFYADPTRITNAQCPSVDGHLEFEMHTVDYDSYANAFNMVGRTIEGHSVHLRVQRPYFDFYVSHRSVTTGELSDFALQTLQANINAHLTEVATERHKYKQLDDWSSVNVTVAAVQRKPYIGYHPNTKRMLHIRYHQDDLLYALRKVVEELLPGCKLHESTISPVDQLKYDRDIYIRGWVRVPMEALRTPETRSSLTELEFHVDEEALCGFSPNKGVCKDPRWQRTAPYRQLAFDAEMLNTAGRFPKAEQDPIVSICAYGDTVNRNSAANLMERVRNPASGKSQELRQTGRSNYDDAVAFAVGSVAPIATEAFHKRYLPNIPDPPKGAPPELASGRDTKGAYAEDYVISIRKWNEFVDRYQDWKSLVGLRRAKAVASSKKLFATMCALTKRPDGTDPKKCWDDSRIAEWEKHAARIGRMFAARNTRSIEKIREPQTWLEECAAMEQAQAEFEFGTVHARWHLFQKTKRVFAFETEEAMLRGFCKYVREYDPDMLTGYNSNGFDLPYIIRRIQIKDIREPETGKLISLGRMPVREDIDEVKTSYSKATGERLFHTPHIALRDCYDFMHFVMRDHKLQDYRLAAVSQNFLRDTKNDVPYSAIPSLFRNNRERLNDYCMKDAELVLMLINYLNNANFLVALARLIGTIPLERLYVDGKQAQVFAVLRRFLAYEGQGKVIPDRNPFSQEGESDGKVGYEGAHVFRPKTLGLYDKLLLCLDYASLYPSIMLAFNLGHDTAGTKRQMLKHGVDLSRCFKTEGKFLEPKTGLMKHYYFLQPRKLTKPELEATGIAEDDATKLPGRKEFWVPQFGEKRTRMMREEMQEHLKSVGFDEEAREALINCEIKPEAPEDPVLAARHARVHAQIKEFLADVKETLRHFPEVPDRFSPKCDDSALVGAEKWMLWARKAIKGDMESLKPSDDLYKKLDSQQASLKIICNSLYGATGVKVGKLAGQHISATVTREGKRTILDLAAKVAAKFDGDTQGGDTDSIFCHFPSIPTLDKVYEKIRVTDEVTGEYLTKTRVQEIVDYANSLVPPPMKIEFEKAYSKYFVPSSAGDNEDAPKKRSAFVVHTPFWDAIRQMMRFPAQGKIGVKGLETTRRDSCLIAQETLMGFFTRILSDDEYAVEKAVEYARAQVEKVDRGEVPFHQLVQARQLSKRTYNVPLPHTELCEKKRKRGEEVPELGTRIPFVVVTGRQDRKFYQSVEDPDYALEHNLQLDHHYVIEKKIMTPIKRFTSVMPNTVRLDEGIFGGLKGRHRENILEDDPVFRMVQIMQPCAGCGENTPDVLCARCSGEANWEELWRREHTKRSEIAVELEKALKTCRACMAIDETEEVICGNTSCPEYFPRKRAEFDLKNHGTYMATLEAFRQRVVPDAMAVDVF